MVYDGKIIGSVGFVDVSSKHKVGEIGYWIAKEFEGKGLVTQAVRAVIKFGFTEYELHRIMIRCNERNIRSGNIPKKLGFTLEGVLREARFVDGNFDNMVIWGLLKGEYEG